MIRSFIIAIAFILFLTGNWLAALFGMESVVFENRAKNEFPALAIPGSLKDWPGPEISAALKDRLPLRYWATRTGNKIQFHGFKDSPAAEVLLGNEGWLFLADTLYDWPCQPGSAAEVLLPKFAEFDRVVSASGKRGVVLISPNKASLYPEKLNAWQVRAQAACANGNRAALREAAENNPYILQLWDAFESVKSGYEVPQAVGEDAHLNYLFRPGDRHWSLRLGMEQANQLVARLSGNSASEISAEMLTQVTRMHSELDTRFFSIGLIEPYFKVRNPDRRKVTSRESIRIPKTPRNAIRFENPNAPNRGHVVILHDSFILASERYIAGAFESVTFIHRQSFRPEDATIQIFIFEADYIVIQSVEDLLWQKNALFDGINQILGQVGK